MDRLIGLTSTFLGRFGRYDDDWVDRLYRQWTCLMMIIFATVVGTKQFAGDPILCYPRTAEQQSHEKYINAICWVKNTYVEPVSATIDPGNVSYEISYYQWVPFALLLQTLFFYTPCFFWRTVSSATYIRIEPVMTLAADIKPASDTYERSVKQISNFLISHFDMNYPTRFSCCGQGRRCLGNAFLMCGRRYGNSVFLFYMISKVIYFGMAILQIYLMDRFLSTDLTEGKNFLELIWTEYFTIFDSNNIDWLFMGRFPKITWCHYDIKHLGSITHSNKVQCVLSINLFNEKIYLFLFTWLILLAILTVLSSIGWLLTMLWPNSRYNFVKTVLKTKKSINKDKKRFIADFVNSYLKIDGVFIIHMLKVVCGELLVHDVLDKLWLGYLSHQEDAVLWLDSTAGAGKPDDTPQLPTSKSKNALDDRGPPGVLSSPGPGVAKVVAAFKRGTVASRGRRHPTPSAPAPVTPIPLHHTLKVVP